LKTYVLDANALLTLIDNKPDQIKVNSLLKEALRGHSQTLMSSVNFAEVYGLLVRRYGKDTALQSVSAIRPLPIQLAEATTQRCLHAAEIKETYKLYYIDAFAAALAIEHKGTLVTSDTGFKKLGHNFPVLWLRTN
jgi:predicted nucleic acid-binding protein